MATQISVDQVISDFNKMYVEKWTYGAETREGNVDCSGAFVWSFLQHGLSIYHGSNRIARTEVVELIPYALAVLKPGMAAFKTYKPGDACYALPNSYREGGANYNGDLLDYHHIGLVAEDCKTVYNAKGTKYGFCKSTYNKYWTHVAYLKKIDYGTTIESTVSIIMATAIVTGGSLNMRSSASLNASKITSIPKGASVSVIEETSSDWIKVQYGENTGYVMRKYLTTTDYITVSLPRSVWEQLNTAITSSLSQLNAESERG